MPLWLYVLWPGFISAAIGETLFFALIDPKQLYLLGEPVDWSPIAVYSTGFFLFWALTSLSALLCVLFLKPERDINGVMRLPPRFGSKLHSANHD